MLRILNASTCLIRWPGTTGRRLCQLSGAAAARRRWRQHDRQLVEGALLRPPAVVHSYSHMPPCTQALQNVLQHTMTICHASVGGDTESSIGIQVACMLLDITGPAAVRVHGRPVLPALPQRQDGAAARAGAALLGLHATARWPQLHCFVRDACWHATLAGMRHWLPAQAVTTVKPDRLCGRSICTAGDLHCHTGGTCTLM